MTLQAPFIAGEGHGELHIFRRPEDVGIDLEPIDVRNGKYKVYDCTGMVVELLVGPVVVRRRPWYLGDDWRCDMAQVPQSAEVRDAEGLVLALNRALDLIKDDPRGRPTDLDGLLSLAISRFGYSP